MRPVLLSISALFLVTAAPPPAPAQGELPAAGAATTPAQADPAGDASLSPDGEEAYPAATVPQAQAQSQEARTLRAYRHVFAAFAVAWILLLGYALSLGRRFAHLDGEVRRLRRADD